jgi:hypothetical protein
LCLASAALIKRGGSQSKSAPGLDLGDDDPRLYGCRFLVLGLSSKAEWSIVSLGLNSLTSLIETVFGRSFRLRPALFPRITWACIWLTISSIWVSLWRFLCDPLRHAARGPSCHRRRQSGRRSPVGKNATRLRGLHQLIKHSEQFAHCDSLQYLLFNYSVLARHLRGLKGSCATLQNSI